MRVTTVLWIALAAAVGVGGVKLIKANGFDLFASRPAELKPDDPRHTTGDKRIVMLAAQWCGYCEKLRKDFELANVRYSLIDIDTEAGQRAMEAVGARGVPVTIIGQDIVYGYNMDEIKDRMEPLGYRL
ncbi:glutaredoxin family protein [Lysobacter capsici]|uniref:glutaredoxin family protein n=1 Tax=Lysobacter capsici TaxID=435897 RepID=UPI0007164467|nr:glutaredoxin domain-containing protein [Lysobacter capsici]ALN87164.1 glutaredoxin family protein [Lysobacter capsici]UOF13620.1 glutaredoxin family protein [Lysobacter capsici]